MASGTGVPRYGPSPTPLRAEQESGRIRPDAGRYEPRGGDGESGA
jgi:hypothetical protein